MVDRTGFLYCLPSLHQQSLLLAAAAASAEAVSASGAQAAVNGSGSGRGSALFSDQFFLLIHPKETRDSPLEARASVNFLQRTVVASDLLEGWEKRQGLAKAMESPAARSLEGQGRRLSLETIR